MKHHCFFVASAILGMTMSMPVQAKDTTWETTTDKEPYKTAESLKDALQDYPDFLSDSMDAYENETEMGTIVIPGLYQTASLGWGKTKSVCTSMTPQGITTDDSHIYVSAYCHEHQHESVIYQMDKETGKLQQTIVLDGMPHTGSIAYDPDHDLMWVAAYTGKHATANSIKMSDIENYEPGTVVQWNTIQELEELSRDSFFTWKDGSLYCGTFAKTGEMHVHQYDIDDNAALTHKEEKVKPESTDTIGNNAQGIAFYNDSIITSCSDGPTLNSQLYVYSQGEKDLLPEDASQSLTLPPRSEQIWVDGNKLYVLFESGAKAYRDEGLVVNRIMTIDMNKFID